MDTATSPVNHRDGCMEVEEVEGAGLDWHPLPGSWNEATLCNIQGKGAGLRSISTLRSRLCLVTDRDKPSIDEGPRVGLDPTEKPTITR